MTRYCIAALAVLAFATTASGQPLASSGFPGDRGRPGDGLPMTGPPPGPPPVDQVAASVPIKVAIQLGKAAEAACHGYKIGVAIIDAAGLPKLSYVADGASGGHAYTAFRKAYTALTFKMPTSQVGSLTKTDPGVAARVKADSNLLTFAGGMPLIVGDQIIGAIGVSGAEPSAKDEECGLAGINKIKDRLK